MDGRLDWEILKGEVEQVDGVTAARLWRRVPGRERLYIDTKKLNGGRNWNGGLGYRSCYIDLGDGSVVLEGEAGAKTRNWHNEHGTREALEALAARMVTPASRD